MTAKKKTTQKTKLCGAKTRSGKPCRHEKGWGTDHPGEGRCKLHGGASLRGVNSATFKTGEHSKYFDPSTLVGFDEWRESIGPGLALEEDLLAMMFVVRESVLKGEPITYMTKDGPVEMNPTAEYVSRCMERVARAAEKLWHHREGLTVNVRVDNDQVRVLLEVMGRALAMHVKSKAQREAVMVEIETAGRDALTALDNGGG